MKKANKTSFCSQDKSLSKSTRSHDSFYQLSNYLHSSNHQINALFRNKTSSKKPINLYSISNFPKNTINTALKKQTSSITQKDLKQFINDNSIQSKSKTEEEKAFSQQQKQTSALNHKKAHTLFLKKKKEMTGLSNSMSYSFLKAIHDPLNKLKNYHRSSINISKDVICDYKSTNNPNKMRNSKRKYHRILDLYYEQKREFQKNNVIERETIFNEAKASEYNAKKSAPKRFFSIGLQKIAEQINSSIIYEKAKQLYKDFNNKRNEEKAKQVADSICNIDFKPYSEINAKIAKKTFDKYHKPNLARAIKIVNIEKNRVDVDDIEYYLSNNKILKRLLQQNQRDIQNEKQSQIKSNISKKCFKQTTLNKIKMYNGYYFGVPV